MKFWKLEGLGNDFICINDINESIKNPNQLAKKLCNRRFGIGADGLILINQNKDADIKMVIINSDGSEPEICGNGLRCFAKLVYKIGLIKKKEFIVNTLAGNRIVKIKENGYVLVEMGIPSFDLTNILSIKPSTSQIINKKIKFNNLQWDSTFISIGNPHVVIRVDNIDIIDISKIGPLIENDPMFKNGTNVEFIKIIDKKTIKQRTWERGVGETYACGSGATAAAIASILSYDVENSVKVQLLGGELNISWNKKNQSAWMEGDANFVYQGVYDN